MSPKEMTEFFLQLFVVPTGSGVMAAQTLLLLPVLQGLLLVGVWCASSFLVDVLFVNSSLVDVLFVNSPLMDVWCVNPPLEGVLCASFPLVGGIQNTGTSLREAALVFGLPALIGLQLPDLFISRSVF